MNNKTKQWIRLLSVPVFFIGCFIVYTNWTKLYPNEVTVVPSTMPYMEPRANLGLKCVQLYGDERKFQDTDDPQVECYTDTPGTFFWDFVSNAGSLETTFWNPEPANAMGYIFNSDPGIFRVQFRDLFGNMETVFMTVEFTKCVECTNA